MRYLLVLAILALPVNVYSWSAQVVKVPDGDTVHVQDDAGKIVKIRLYGIDCPEKKQEYGKTAQRMTEKLLTGKRIEIIPVSIDKYKRTVAGLVLIDDMMVLQDMLITNGLAWVDDRFCKALVCDLWRIHQQDAKKSEYPRGVWKSNNPIPPWIWRKQQRKRYK